MHALGQSVGLLEPAPSDPVEIDLGHPIRSCAAVSARVGLEGRAQARCCVVEPRFDRARRDAERVADLSSGQPR